jgi:hypothetical protein
LDLIPEEERALRFKLERLGMDCVFSSPENTAPWEKLNAILTSELPFPLKHGWQKAVFHIVTGKTYKD